MDKTKKIIVVSAVNLNIGGTLTILRDCLSYLSRLVSNGNFQVIALVHNKELALYDNIDYIEIPWAKSAWVNRIWCEYVTMKKISKRIGPIFLWFSLHDTTPNVMAKRRAVYCHNPFPFYKWKFHDIFMNYKIVMFSLFSYFIYKINIHKNDFIVLQQEWIRNAFVEMFRIQKSKIVVANPIVASNFCFKKVENGHKMYTFMFPSSPNLHKNFETLCNAADLLEKEIGTNKFRVVITINGEENKYARWLYREWNKIKSIEFVGFLTRKELYDFYQTSDCLVFPSKVETWGLPISEFMETRKPMLLADLPYAHETAAGSQHTAFFPAENAVALKEMMKRLFEGDDSFLGRVENKSLQNPQAQSWEELFDLLLE